MLNQLNPLGIVAVTRRLHRQFHHLVLPVSPQLARPGA